MWALEMWNPLVLALFAVDAVECLLEQARSHLAGADLGVDEIDQCEHLQLVVSRAICSVVGGPDVSDGRAVFTLQSERAEEHVKPGATRVVGANLGERLLGQFACCGLVPAEVGKV